jgi:hypothetical protein
MLGGFRQYNTALPPCTSAAARQIGKPLFFGRSPAVDEPMFVAMDFEQYQIARKGMVIATTVAVALGVALVVVAVRKGKKRSFY